MPRFDTGVVSEVLQSRDGIVRVTIKIGRRKRKATGFTRLTGELAVGDRVVVNTTAVDLDLGTGGEDFVVWNLEKAKSSSMSGGHILKLRYTPSQLDVLVAEAPESSHHKTLKEATSLAGMPVVACGLHSQIAPVIAMMKYLDPDLKIAYIMTDGAALPLPQSDLVAEMRQGGLIDGTITCGHAFGGDIECVNIFTALVTASEVVGADLAVAAMGPGIVGTSTALGHTGMEQGQILAAVAALGGSPVAALRVSFAETRPRHIGVSSHSLTALRFGTSARCTMAVPDMEIDRLNTVMTQLFDAGLTEMHDVRIVDAWETPTALEKFKLSPSTMGRSVAEDSDFFEAAGAAGLLAARMIYEAGV